MVQTPCRNFDFDFAMLLDALAIGLNKSFHRLRTSYSVLRALVEISLYVFWSYDKY